MQGWTSVCVMSVCAMMVCVCACISASEVAQQLCRETSSVDDTLHEAGPPALTRERREVRTDYEEEEEGEEEEEVGPPSLLTLLKTMLPPPADTIALHEAERSLERRAYSMQHFRWGKPKGKRRPIKVLLGMTGSDPQETGGDELEAWPVDVAMEGRRSLGEESAEEMTPPTITPTNRMQHIAAPANSLNPFLLGSGPGPSQKRYGGFMRPHTTSSHRDLLTLLKQAIAREHQGHN